MITPERQVVTLHTVQGVQLYQFLGSELVDLTWSRDAEQVSRCEMTVPSTLEYNRLPDITPWLHWVSVWDDTGQILYWTGPIQKTAATRDSMSISARDMACLFSRTRCPLAKRWDVVWPVTVAEELIDRMVELHGLEVKPVVQPVRPLQYDERYSFTAKGDEAMLDTTMDELVRLGLRWSVVAGVPILGQLPRTPFVSLVETDFVGGGLTIVRDGTTTFNDVLLRGADNLSRARVDMAGLNLQTIVNIDDMFGVSNVDRAVKQYTRYTSQIRDTVTLPDNAVLHPEAPVDLDQLIPSARFTIDAYGLLLPMELTGIDVRVTSESAAVSVRMVSVNDELPELIEIQNQSSISGAAQ